MSDDEFYGQLKTCRGCGVKVPIPDKGPMRCPVCDEFFERRESMHMCPKCGTVTRVPHGLTALCSNIACKEVLAY